MAIHNWLTGLGFPDSAQDYRDLITNEDNYEDVEKQYSDGSLHILNSNFRDTAIVKFSNLFPINLTSLEFEADATDFNYFTAEATFKYTIYDIVAPDNRTPL